MLCKGGKKKKCFHKEMWTYFKNKDYIFILVLCSAPPDLVAYSVIIKLVKHARNDFLIIFLDFDPVRC